MPSTDLRFLTHVVAHDCMALVPGQFQVFRDQCTLDSALGGIGNRLRFLLLEYNGWDPEERVTQQVIEIPRDDLDATMRQMSPCFRFTDAWRASWSHMPLGPSATISFAIPLIVTLPRNLRDPQVMLAVCTFHTSTPSQYRYNQAASRPPHIRWLYRY